MDEFIRYIDIQTCTGTEEESKAADFLKAIEAADQLCVILIELSFNYILTLKGVYEKFEKIFGRKPTYDTAAYQEFLTLIWESDIFSFHPSYGIGIISKLLSTDYEVPPDSSLEKIGHLLAIVYCYIRISYHFKHNISVNISFIMSLNLSAVKIVRETEYINAVALPATDVFIRTQRSAVTRKAQQRESFNEVFQAYQELSKKRTKWKTMSGRQKANLIEKHLNEKLKIKSQNSYRKASAIRKDDIPMIECLIAYYAQKRTPIPL